MSAPVSPTAVACPCCSTLLYRHPALGMRELLTGRPHSCPVVARLAAVQAAETPWEDIDT